MSRLDGLRQRHQAAMDKVIADARAFAQECKKATGPITYVQPSGAHLFPFWQRLVEWFRR